MRQHLKKSTLTQRHRQNSIQLHRFWLQAIALWLVRWVTWSDAPSLRHLFQRFWLVNVIRPYMVRYTHFRLYVAKILQSPVARVLLASGHMRKFYCKMADHSNLKWRTRNACDTAMKEPLQASVLAIVQQMGLFQISVYGKRVYGTETRLFH